MRYSFLAGFALLIVGTIKAWTHMQAPATLADYLAYRCGGAAVEGSGWFAQLMAGHCWGCPVALAGAALILIGSVQAFVSRGPGILRSMPVRVR